MKVIFAKTWEYLKVKIMGIFSSSERKSEIFRIDARSCIWKWRSRVVAVYDQLYRCRVLRVTRTIKKSKQRKVWHKKSKIVKYIWTQKFSQTFLTFHIWFLLQNRICLPPQLHTAWRHINITFLKKMIVLLSAPILRIPFIKGSPELFEN